MEYLDFELPIKDLINQLEKTTQIGQETKSNVNDLKKEIELKLKEKKKEIVREISSIIASAKEEKYESRYKKLDDGKSIAYISDFIVDGGEIRIWCENSIYPRSNLILPNT